MAAPSYVPSSTHYSPLTAWTGLGKHDVAPRIGPDGPFFQPILRRADEEYVPMRERLPEDELLGGRGI